jgi:ABC-type multidrug transport system fused ATPase/permease subunit
VLRRLSLTIAAGSKVALCGRTGCGKSSLLSVLARLYPTEAGRVHIGGRDIALTPLVQLRRALRVVTQVRRAH